MSLPAVAKLGIVLWAVPLTGQVRITQDIDRVKVVIDGKPYTDFVYGADVTKPYLHPLRSATGVIVTRAFPVEKRGSGSTDHAEHRDLWFSHSNVNGDNFYANEKTFTTLNRGAIAVRKIDRIRSGKRWGAISATLGWVDHEGREILRERREMVFYSGSAQRVMDFSFALTALVPVKFGDHRDGMFSIRVTDALQEAHTGDMTSAEGCRKEKGCWGKRSKWMDYSGEVEGEKLGIAIFDHPGNPRHPAYWHSRGYGLFASNIFGVNEFTRNPAVDSSLTLAPRETLRFRYRLLIHPGDARDAELERQYADYVKSSLSRR